MGKKSRGVAHVRWLGVMTGLLAAACGDSMGPGGSPPPPPPPPPAAFPDLLSDLDIDVPSARLFEPRWKLWTNGSLKERKVLLTEGGAIGIQNRSRWSFPDGARFTKTFAYFTQSSPDELVPIETRIILKRNGGWETAAYRWRTDLSDADLLSGDAPVPVPVTLADGTSFDHVIPSRDNCQTCHGSNPTFILGFSELQLNSTLDGQGATQLETFDQAGFFDSPMPSDPFEVQAPDALTRDVLGYAQGNCVHCHNATSPITTLDLSHGVFLENTVNRTASNGQTLITPNDPDASYLLEEFSTGIMPLLGVQLLDEAMSSALRDWITTHDFGG